MKPKNILCFIADDTDFINLPAYGAQGVLCPTLDTLAKEGMVFEQAYCASAACTPSRFNYLTGRYCGHSKDPEFLTQYPKDDLYSIEWNAWLNGDQKTLAHFFREQGYATGYFGKWHNGYEFEALDIPPLFENDDPRDPEVQGRLQTCQQAFQAMVKEGTGFDIVDSIVWANADEFPVKALRHHNPEWITHKALNFLDVSAHQQQPFFLWLASTIFHGPEHHKCLEADPTLTFNGIETSHLNCQPSRESVKRRLREAGLPINHQTVGMLWLDDMLAALIEKLMQLSLYDDTLICFLVDHNTEPGKASCYQKGSRIPMIIKPSGNSPVPQSRPKEPVQNIDLLPTLLDYNQFPVPEEIDGQSFYALFCQPENVAPLDRTLFLENGFTRGIVRGRWKYIALRFPKNIQEKILHGNLEELPNHLNRFRQGQPHITMTEYLGYFDPDQLYDLANDPEEQNNLATDPAFSDKLKEMKDLLKEQCEQFEHPFPIDETDFFERKEYLKAKSKLMAVGTDFIEWWPQPS